jgi:DNA polymerase|tara:strand:- start:437 stop:1117 length:681 start_codon:yes stop_codon:yes gene_type:complete
LNDEKLRYFKQYQELFGNEVFLSIGQQGPNINSQDKREILKKRSTDLISYNNEIKNCLKCELGSTRNNFVFGVGDPKASLMLVGEAPGEQEDLKGEPFVGRAGKLLDQMLSAINRSREKDVFICNVLKCRPPDNRDPSKNEIEKCEPYLVNQIDLIQPKLIVALGRVAGKTLLSVDKSLKDMRNIIHNYHGTDLIVTYHPAALLRNSNWKPDAWKDFKWIRSLIDK